MPAMANRHYQTILTPCDGQNIEGRNNASIVLDYYQTCQIHAIYVIRDIEEPGQSGRCDVSQDFYDPSGQFRIISLFDDKRDVWRSFSPNSIQIPAGQAIAIEWSGSGGGYRQYTVEIWFT